MQREAIRLGRVQRWMQACIVAPGPVRRAIRRKAARSEFEVKEAESLIRASRTLAPLERLDIYRGMYELRLCDALRADYPGLAHLLGEERFEELASLYISAHPSRSYTLNRLGDHLPAFIGRADGLPRPLLVRDLARLELAATEVFDEEKSAALAGDCVAAVPPEEWAGLRFRPVAALRALELSYPVHRYLEALRDGRPAPAMRPRKGRVIVYRRDYALLYLELSSPAFTMFTSLAEGRRLGEALEDMMLRHKRGTANQQEWFRQWFSEGLFSRMDRGDSAA